MDLTNSCTAALSNLQGNWEVLGSTTASGIKFASKNVRGISIVYH